MALFPITDPSRADDIRMRRRRAGWLLVGIVAVPVILSSGSHKSSASRHPSAGHDSDDPNIDLSSMSIRSGSLPGTQIQSILNRIPLVRGLNWMVVGAPLPGGSRAEGALSVAATSLVVAVPCADSITLVPQTDLSGHVYVSTKDRQPDGTAGLLLTGGTKATLSGSCEHGKYDLVIQAPAAMKLTIAQSADTDLRLGAFTGPITLSQNGSGDAVIDAAGTLIVQKSGSGDLAVGRLAGNLHMAQAGSGDTTINLAESPEVIASMQGSGNLTIPAGHIGRLTTTFHGSGDLSVAAEIGDATVQAGENTDVSLPHVTGHLTRNVIGATEE